MSRRSVFTIKQLTQVRILKTNIYEGAFFTKIYNSAFSRELFSQKRSIVGVQLGSKYVSDSISPS